MKFKGFNRWLYRKHRSDGLIDGKLTSDVLLLHLMDLQLMEMN